MFYTQKRRLKLSFHELPRVIFALPWLCRLYYDSFKVVSKEGGPLLRVSVYYLYNAHKGEIAIWKFLTNNFSFV